MRKIVYIKCAINCVRISCRNVNFINFILNARFARLRERAAIYSSRGLSFTIINQSRRTNNKGGPASASENSSKNISLSDINQPQKLVKKMAVDWVYRIALFIPI